MHHPDFLKLEGSWRGLNYLVSNTITDSQLKIKLLNASKAEIAKDLAKATDFDQSDTFKRIYTASSARSVASRSAPDRRLRVHRSSHRCRVPHEHVEHCGGSLLPFISSTNSKMFGLESFSDLSKPKTCRRTSSPWSTALALIPRPRRVGRS